MCSSILFSFLVRTKNSSATIFNEKVLIGLWGVLDFPVTTNSIYSQLLKQMFVFSNI